MILFWRNCSSYSSGYNWSWGEYIKVVLYLSCELCTEEACKRRLPQKEKRKNTPKSTDILKQTLLDQRFSNGFFSSPSTRAYQSFDSSAWAVSMSNLRSEQVYSKGYLSSWALSSCTQLHKGVMWKKRFKSGRMGNRGQVSTYNITKIIKRAKALVWADSINCFPKQKSQIECASLHAGPTSVDASAWWERQVPSAISSQPSDQSNSNKLGKVPSDYTAAVGSPSTSRVAQQGCCTHLRWTSAPNPRPQGEKSGAPGWASNRLLQVGVMSSPANWSLAQVLKVGFLLFSLLISSM